MTDPASTQIDPDEGNEQVTDDVGGTTDTIDTSTTTKYQFQCNEKHGLNGDAFYGPVRDTESEAVADQSAHLERFPDHVDQGVLPVGA